MMNSPRIYLLLLIMLAGCSFQAKEKLDVAEKLDLFEQIVQEVYASSDWAEFVEYGESSTSIYPGQAYSDALNQAIMRIPKIKFITLQRDSTVLFKGECIGATALRQDCALAAYAPNGDCIEQLERYGEINDILSVNCNWCEGLWFTALLTDGYWATENAMKKRSIIFLSLFALLFGCGNGNYQNVKVDGFVKNKLTQAPIGNAEIQIKFWLYDREKWESISVERAATTNLEGYFEVKVEEAEAFDLRIEIDGYESFEESKTLVARNLRMEILLAPR